MLNDSVSHNQLLRTWRSARSLRAAWSAACAASRSPSCMPGNGSIPHVFKHRTACKSADRTYTTRMQCTAAAAHRHHPSFETDGEEALPAAVHALCPSSDPHCAARYR